jgi:hypothetical protein
MYKELVVPPTNSRTLKRDRIARQLNCEACGDTVRRGLRCDDCTLELALRAGHRDRDLARLIFRLGTWWRPTAVRP